MLLKYARARVLVEGDVKDFAFRYFTKEKSNMLGLKGWVKKLPSEDVEIVLEGLEDNINEMLEWCKKGPTLFKTNIIKVEFADFEDEFDNFEIRY